APGQPFHRFTEAADQEMLAVERRLTAEDPKDGRGCSFTVLNDPAQQRGGPTVSYELPEAERAWPVCLYVHFHSQRLVGSILFGGVARRSFGRVRHDLLLQIDPSASDRSAGYILRP